MKRSPAIPPRAASLADPETTSQHGGLNDLISDGDTGIGSSRRSPPIASSGRHELQKSDTLEAQRRTLAEGIAAEARVTGITAKLDETGRSFFTKAGFADRIDRPSDIEVTTNWLKPVIQERVTQRIHTEYTTEIRRDIHKHHIYPKIQPIYDPDPILLPTRHRFFSTIDGNWHEVIGDEAAIAILGEDVFLHGPKIMRQVRALVTPDFKDEAPVAGSERRVIERQGEEVDGHAKSDWKVVAGQATDDDKITRDGRIHDGLEGLEEGVPTLHMTI